MIYIYITQYIFISHDIYLYCVLSHIWLLATPQTVVHQDPLSMGILQAWILKWVAMPSSMESSQTRQEKIEVVAGTDRWLCLGTRASNPRAVVSWRDSRLAQRTAWCNPESPGRARARPCEMSRLLAVVLLESRCSPLNEVWWSLSLFGQALPGLCPPSHSLLALVPKIK